MTPEEPAMAFPYPDAVPDFLDAQATALYEVAALLADVGGDVDDANLTLMGSWKGDAALSCVTDINLMAPQLPQDATTIGDGSTEVKHYAQKVRDARESIDGIRRRYETQVTHLNAENRKIPGQLPDEDRQSWREGNEADFTSAIGPLQTEYDEDVMAPLTTAAVNAYTKLWEATDTLSPREYRGEHGDVGTGAYLGIGAELSLAVTMDGDFDPERRANQFAAYVDLYGHPPSGQNEWTMAAILDPESYMDKNNGVDATIQVGRITPRPGGGIVRIGWYIPSDDVFNVPDWDLGDDRSFDPGFDPEDSRVALYIDYETGMIVARQNPSVSSDGEVKIGTPSIRVQEQADGRIRLFYDASNALAPPGGNATGHTVNGDIVVTPPSGDLPAKVDGTVGDYPSLEVYGDNSQGQTSVIVQDEADSDAPYGPLWYLTQHHEVGSGATAVDDFYDDPEHRHIGPRNPFLKYPDRYPDTTLGDPSDPPQIYTIP